MEERIDRIMSAVERIDERTQKTADDVDHLMRIVAIGNGDLPLTVKVAKIDERLTAATESKAEKWKFRASVSVGVLALIGVIFQSCM